MRRFMLLLLISLSVISFAGCNKETPKESSTEAKDNINLKYTASMEGEITSFSGNELTIITSDRREITFQLGNATMDLENGISEGDNATVYYTGSIRNTDTSNVKVAKVVVEEGNRSTKGDKKDTDKQAEKETEDEEDIVTVEPQEVKDLDSLPGMQKEEQETEEEFGTEIQKVNQTVTVISSVNYRERPQKDSPILGALDTGDSVLRTGICDNGWSRVKVDGKTAYVWGEYLSE